ncbi:MAG: Hpt domain-containing protein, partial [Actinobacteria bacterium]|nr:Hpt domain-containing protein [Actinomycetota bacterium]
LKKAHSRADAATVASLAHKLKGSSNRIGATHVARIADKLQGCAKAKRLKDAAGLLRSLATAVDETEAAFRERLADREYSGSRKTEAAACPTRVIPSGAEG